MENNDEEKSLQYRYDRHIKYLLGALPVMCASSLIIYINNPQEGKLYLGMTGFLACIELGLIHTKNVIRSYLHETKKRE